MSAQSISGLPPVELSLLAPNPSLGAHLDDRQITDITDTVDEARSAAVSPTEQLVKGLIKVAVAITLLALAGAILSNPVSALVLGTMIFTIIVASALTGDAVHGFVKGYKEHQMSVTKDAITNRISGMYTGQFLPPGYQAGRQQMKQAAQQMQFPPYAPRFPMQNSYFPHFQPQQPQPVAASDRPPASAPRSRNPNRA